MSGDGSDAAEGPDVVVVEAPPVEYVTRGELVAVVGELETRLGVRIDEAMGAAVEAQVDATVAQATAEDAEVTAGVAVDVALDAAEDAAEAADAAEHGPDGLTPDEEPIDGDGSAGPVSPPRRKKNDEGEGDDGEKSERRTGYGAHSIFGKRG